MLESFRIAPKADAAKVDGNGHPPDEIRLDLTVRDAEVVAELAKRDDGPPRIEFALSALRLGVLAIRQASGGIDSAAIRAEGERLMAGVGEAMLKNGNELFTELSKLVTNYFDPATGQLPQRLERLVKKDGELESLLGRQLGGDTCVLAQTLAKHIGQDSPIFKLLSPKQSEGLLAALAKTLDDALRSQRETILTQFSLDHEGSALSRLVKELTDANGTLKTDLSKNIDNVVKEFSLDNEQGALARLVGRVEKAQGMIRDQFSLDNKESALSRLSGMLDATNRTIAASLTLDNEKSPLYLLRLELLRVIEALSKANTDFQGDVRARLSALSARKEEAALGTRHGLEFEDAVGAVLQREAQRLGDVCAATGSTVGIIRNCKIGDHVITLGAESAAPGANIVCEAKEKAAYRMREAIDEIAQARENRQAQAGIFVFSKTTAPEGIESFARHGQDVFVVWDREDAACDLLVRVAYSVARALVVRESVAKQRSQADFNELDGAVAQIGKEVELLAEVATTAGSIIKGGEKIKDRAERMQRSLEKQLGTLREHLDQLKHEATDGAT